MLILSKTVNFLNFQQKVLLTVEEVVKVDVNQFCSIIATHSSRLIWKFQWGTMNTLSTQSADNKDILNVFVVISEYYTESFKGFTVKYSIFGWFMNICLIWWWNISSHTPTASLDRRVPAPLFPPLMWNGSLG